MISFVTQLVYKDDHLKVYLHDNDTNAIVENFCKKIAANSYYARVELKKPYARRTTGEKSQNHAINGFVQQICKYTGDNFDDIKMYAKRQAIKRGYPIQKDENGDDLYSAVTGKVIPESEANIDTIQAGYLIDELKDIAAFLNIRLKE